MWWRSVRARVIGVTALVVVTSVVLTAVMVSLAVQRAALEEAARSLSNDATIYQSLLDYGTEHDSWADVDTLIGELSERYDRRIALKTKDGRLVVDSNALLRLSTGALRAKPEVEIDPYNPQLEALESEFATGGVIVAPDATGEDRAVNAARVSAATACLDRLAIPHQETVGGTGLTDVSVDVQLTDEQWEAASGCLQGMYLPLPSELERISAEHDALVTCLHGAGIEPEIASDDYGDIAFVDMDDPVQVRAYDACLEQGLRAQFAPPVQLYLGSAGTTGLSLSGLATGNTVLIVFGIIVIAGFAAVALSARIVRPLRALTTAAALIGVGDRQVRVAVTDRSEIGALATTFNTMADSLAHSEQARRRMVADIAHELRNPLVTLNGGLEAIQDGVYQPTPEVIDSLVEETEHLRRMVSDLQELATADAGALRVEREPVDITALLAAAAVAYEPLTAAAGVSIHVEAPEATVVEGDETRLRQVVTNLLTNAISHTPRGGTVTLTATTSSGETVITVADTGEGISAEELPFVFERFWRAEPARSRTSGRTGLGLAICDALIRAHDGTITAKSEPGTGTTFAITLPNTRPMPGSTEKPPSASAPDMPSLFDGRR